MSEPPEHKTKRKFYPESQRFEAQQRTTPSPFDLRSYYICNPLQGECNLIFGEEKSFDVRFREAEKLQPRNYFSSRDECQDRCHALPKSLGGMIAGFKGSLLPDVSRTFSEYVRAVPPKMMRKILVRQGFPTSPLQDTWNLLQIPLYQYFRANDQKHFVQKLELLVASDMAKFLAAHRRRHIANVESDESEEESYTEPSDSVMQKEATRSRNAILFNLLRSMLQRKNTQEALNFVSFLDSLARLDPKYSIRAFLPHHVHEFSQEELLRMDPRVEEAFLSQVFSPWKDWKTSVPRLPFATSELMLYFPTIGILDTIAALWMLTWTPTVSIAELEQLGAVLDSLPKIAKQQLRSFFFANAWPSYPILPSRIHALMWPVFSSSNTRTTQKEEPLALRRLLEAYPQWLDQIESRTANRMRRRRRSAR